MKETFVFVRDWHVIKLTLIYATTWDARVVSRVMGTTVIASCPNLPLIYARPLLLSFD